MDPNTCKDPCVVDPLACGCAPDGSSTTMPGQDNTCWPPPEPCTRENCPEDPWWPQNPPTDFGCNDIAPGGDKVPPDNHMPGEGGTR